LKVSWKKAYVHHPFLFHSEAVAALGTALLTHSDKTTGIGKILRQTMMEQNSLALREIKKEVENPAFEPSDEHIHAITLLACQSGTLRESDEPYPLSPLCSLQNMYFFGKFDVTYAHVSAMYDAIALKGGIKTIKQYALADILEAYENHHLRRAC
jgi:hypothetical protein